MSCIYYRAALDEYERSYKLCSDRNYPQKKKLIIPIVRCKITIGDVEHAIQKLHYMIETEVIDLPYGEKINHEVVVEQGYKELGLLLMLAEVTKSQIKRQGYQGVRQKRFYKIQDDGRLLRGTDIDSSDDLISGRTFLAVKQAQRKIDKLKSKDGDGDFESERASWIEKYTTARATAQGFLDEVHRDVVPLKAPIKPPPKKVVEDDGTRKLGRINRDRRLD